jgi:hypothetical protein
MTKTPSAPMSAQQIRDLLSDMTQVEKANWHIDHPTLFEAAIVHKQYTFDEGTTTRDWADIQAYDIGEMFLAYGLTREERERDARQHLEGVARKVALDNRIQGLCWKFYKDATHSWQYLVKYGANTDGCVFDTKAGAHPWLHLIKHDPDHLTARPPSSSAARALEIKTIRRAILNVSDEDAYLEICELYPILDAGIIDEYEGYILLQIAPGVDTPRESVIANAMNGGNPLPPAWRDFLDAREQAIRNGCQELEVRLSEQ